MSERAWTFFPAGGGHPAKLAWALKEHLEARGFRVGRVLRTDWGYRLELPGAELLLAEHATEPGLLELRLRPRGRFSAVLARARLAKAADAVEVFLAEQPGLRLLPVP